MKVAISVVTFSENKDLVSEMKRIFPDYTLNNLGRRYTESELIDSLKDADAAIIGLDRIEENLLKECPKLKVISKHGIGTDKIDFEACEKYGVSVLTQNGTNKRAVSELTLEFILDLMRRGYTASLDMKAGNWNKYNNQGRNLTEKTVGIIGLGNIGKDLVSLLKPFNCRILVNDIREDEEQKTFYKKNNLQEVSKEYIYKQSDVITLHVPLTDLTKDMISGNIFSWIHPSSYLINTCRGHVVNEKDLLTALKNEKIAGVALDVFSTEPPSGEIYDELRKMPNVILTPHMGGTSKEASLALGRTAIENLRNYFKK